MKYNDLRNPLMEKIRKNGDSWEVTNEKGTKVLGTHPTKEEALAQLRAIEANKG